MTATLEVLMRRERMLAFIVNRLDDAVGFEVGLPAS